MYLVLSLVLGSSALYKNLSHRKIASGARPYAKVERRDFVRTVRLNGTTEAVDSFVIAAPLMSGGGMNSLVVTRLTKSGTLVRKGDLLVEFDRQAQSKNALDREAEYKNWVNQVERRKAEHAAELSSDEVELLQAEHAVEIARLESRKNEILSRIDAEKNEQAAEEAQATYHQLQQTFKLKTLSRRAELRVMEIERDLALAAMGYATRNGERLAVRSPIDGVVVLNSIWKSGSMGEISEGDEVRPGTPFMQVVDPSHMQVRSRVNQADIGRIEVGMPVRVSLDAYPGMEFTGRVQEVSIVGETGQLNEKVRYYPVLLSVTGTNPRLMPDLSAAIDVELRRLSNVLVVPRDCILHLGSADFVLVRTSNSVRRVPVTLSEVSDTEAAIESGVDAGALVLRLSEFAEGCQ